jgi:hypothetical protein
MTILRLIVYFNFVFAHNRSLFSCIIFIHIYAASISYISEFFISWSDFIVLFRIVFAKNINGRKNMKTWRICVGLGSFFMQKNNRKKYGNNAFLQQNFLIHNVFLLLVLPSIISHLFLGMHGNKKES